jgi:hypothetical protein
MQVGTEILLARMKEYPDEFFTSSNESRWARIIDESRQYLPKEDVEALDEGYRQMNIDRFNERVLARLAGEGKQPEETLKYKATERYAGGFTDAREQYLLDQQRRAMQNSAMGAQGMSGIGGQLGKFDKWGGIF